MTRYEELDAEIKRLDAARMRIREHWLSEVYDAERSVAFAAELERLTDEIVKAIHERDKEQEVTSS